MNVLEGVSDTLSIPAALITYWPDLRRISSL